MDINDWRKKIDELDVEIVKLISQRAAAALEIGKLKSSEGLPVYEPNREQTVFEKVKTANLGPLTGEEIQDIYHRIIDVMRSLQSKAA